MTARALSNVYRISLTRVLKPILAALLATVSILLLYEGHPFLLLTLAVFLVVLLLLLSLPLSGVYAWLILFPLQSIYIELALGWRVHKIYSVELLGPLALLALLAQVLAGKRSSDFECSHATSSKFSWIYFLSTAFVAWSLLCLLLSQLPREAILNWWKLICNFVLCAFLLTHLNAYEKFIKVIVLFCFLAVVFSLITIYSNYFGLDLSHRLPSPGIFSVKFVANFMNIAGNFDPKMVGMSFSSGLSGRHELGIFLTSATILSLFLIHTSRRLCVKLVLALCILLFVTTQLLFIPKASLLGFVVTIFSICLFIAQWRGYFLHVVVGLAGLFSAASFLSNLLKPTWLQNVGLATSAANLAGQSTFRPGTLGNRLKLMGEAIDVFLSSFGLGGGPDSLAYLRIGGVHGHNFLLSYAADYGVPGVLFAIGMLILLVQLAYSQILACPQTEDSLWLLRVTALACLMIAVFEYSFDCYIWYPQIWLVGAFFLASLRLEQLNPADKGLNRQQVR